MRSLKQTVIPIILLVFCSCSKELVDDEFIVTDNGMPRILNEVEMYLYPNQYFKEGKTDLLFKNPRYDNFNRIVFAYCNFDGYDANFRYVYEDNSITITMSGKGGVTTTRSYTLENNIIVCCKERDSDLASEHIFKYKYDKEGRLSKIDVEYDLKENSTNEEYAVDIYWKDGNISEVIQTNHNGVNQTYLYEYQYYAGYKPEFPSTQHLMNFYIGGVVGVDDILVAEGYFGNSISKDLPIKESFINNTSNEYKYTIGKYGYVTTISQISKGKTIRDYYYKWK